MVSLFNETDPEARSVIEETINSQVQPTSVEVEEAVEVWQRQLRIIKAPVGPDVHPEKPILDLATLAEKLRKYDSQRLAKIYVAYRWNDYVRDKRRWNIDTTFLDDELVARMEQIIEEHSDASEEDVLAAKAACEKTGNWKCLFRSQVVRFSLC